MNNAASVEPSRELGNHTIFIRRNGLQATTVVFCAGNVLEL